MEEESMKPKEDRISNLPDCLIQHILSSLPKTNEAIRTSVLSKQWKKQWTGVPVLILDSNDGTHCRNIFRFLRCSNIKRLHFSGYVKDLDFDEIICFAKSRNVEDLTMCSSGYPHKVLPDLFFDNVSVVTVRAEWCHLMPKGKVNWAGLKSLNLRYCKLSNQAVERILFGSPLLESFLLMNIEGLYKLLVITSKSLKRLVLGNLNLRSLEISCPNLKDLYAMSVFMKDSSLLDPVIQNVVSVSSSLESMQLHCCTPINQLVVSSESLKILVIVKASRVHCLQVSCPKLERLELSGQLIFHRVEFMNLSSSVLVDLRYHVYDIRNWKDDKYWITNILQQLHNVNQLRLGDMIIEVLSGLEVKNLFYPVLRTKCLILNKPHGWKAYVTGLACLLHNLPMLETLVITGHHYKKLLDDGMELTDVQENYWNSTTTVFSCLESHLKTVKVNIDATVREKDWELSLNFVEFLLKNARVLERMAITSIWSEHFKERLLSSPRLSQHVIIEFL